MKTKDQENLPPSARKQKVVKRRRYKPGRLPGAIPGEAPSENDTVKHECYQLYLMGWKPEELAELAKKTVKIIYNWIFVGRWAERRDYFDRLKSKKRKEANAPIVRAVIQANRDGLREKFRATTGEMAVKDAEYWAKMTPQKRLKEASGIAPLNKVHRDNLDLSKEDREGAAGSGGHISLTFLSQADSPGMVKVIDVGSETQRIEDKE